MRIPVLKRPGRRARVTLGVALGLTMLLVGSTGCVAVKPWQREHLASRSMRSPFADDGTRSAYQAKMLESKAGGGLPGSAPGGGCGCSQ